MPNQFQIQKQKKSEWCWAAVSVSIDRYFDSKSTLTQQRIARKVVPPDEANNKPVKLSAALEAINRLRGIDGGGLRFEAISQELDAGRPVCARIGWDGGASHFVVLTGYEILRTGVRNVDVADPLYPDSTVDYEEFQNMYHGDGSWVETFFVTNPPQKWQGHSQGRTAAPNPNNKHANLPRSEYLSAMRTGLANFFDPGDKLAASLLQDYEAHQVFSLGLDCFKDDATWTPQLPKPVGWRFIAAGPASDLGCHVGGSAPRIIGTARTPEISIMRNCLRQIKVGVNQELRALRVPGLLIEALWLHDSKNSKNDLISPFGGFHENTSGPAMNWSLNPMQEYPAAKFFGEIQQAAQDRLKNHIKEYGA